MRHVEELLHVAQLLFKVLHAIVLFMVLFSNEFLQVQIPLLSYVPEGQEAMQFFPEATKLEEHPVQVVELLHEMQSVFSVEQANFLNFSKVNEAYWHRLHYYYKFPKNKKRRKLLQ